MLKKVPNYAKKFYKVLILSAGDGSKGRKRVFQGRLVMIYYLFIVATNVTNKTKKQKRKENKEIIDFKFCVLGEDKRGKRIFLAEGEF